MVKAIQDTSLRNDMWNEVGSFVWMHSERLYTLSHECFSVNGCEHERQRESKSPVVNELHSTPSVSRGMSCVLYGAITYAEDLTTHSGSLKFWTS
jgi:hypothetical protein